MSFSPLCIKMRHTAPLHTSPPFFFWSIPFDINKFNPISFLSTDFLPGTLQPILHPPSVCVQIPFQWPVHAVGRERNRGKSQGDVYKVAFSLMV